MYIENKRRGEQKTMYKKLYKNRVILHNINFILLLINALVSVFWCLPLIKIILFFNVLYMFAWYKANTKKRIVKSH